MYNKGENTIGDFLNAEIQKLISDGTVDKIISKYEPFKGAVIRVGDTRAKDIQ